MKPTTHVGSQRSGKILLSLVVILTLMVMSVPIASWGVAEKPLVVAEDGFAVVTRGHIDQVVTQQGELQSAERNTLTSNCEWSTTIVEIVPEGTYVQPGDVIAVLDDADLRERLQEREVRYINSIAALEQARENLNIQVLTNESKIAAAELKLELAKLKLDAYVNAEHPQKLHQLESAKVLAEETMARAQKSYEFTLSMFKRGYRAHDDCEAERLKVIREENKYAQATDALNIYTDHTYVRNMTQYVAQSQEAERNLERVKIAARSAELSRQITLSSRERSYNIYKAYQERLKSNIEACKIIARNAGEVIHARENSSSAQGIEEGSRVRYLQQIAHIPDRDNLKVELRVHESNIRLINHDSDAIVTIDALQETPFRGTVSHVSKIPTNGRYPNYHLREYKVTVALDIDPELARTIAPGLSADVTIISEQRENALRVPHQSVVEIGGDYYSFVKSGDYVEERIVEVGINDDSQIEIISGLEEGEQVVTKPRVTCASLIASLQDRTDARDGTSGWLAFLD
ncbi:macrolide transporter subunit MacA [Thalassoglobus neptunius]|uniref:Macrolide transporter subunit MacA n=1 Tax=Thalassoglobus neptunius TaxID=1938619 RepID=A0A5C5X7V9_9PLAN|nr:HlyD family efflux transporter periplasmic adaptor subunit [Thalassoglobus neptunius]TWT58353.1 macrolide transporter subunit MacA [Thalassoglobus neptunius]